ncbi:MAG: hypothetical protein LPK79_06505 [Bacteroidota bacterium]|nr:hypothetical protein [Bacteroidota bacterium]
MKTTKFKTTINCNNCLSKVTPTLNQLVGENKWKVDINDPNKPLTLEEPVEAEDVKKSLIRIGFVAEPLN